MKKAVLFIALASTLVLVAADKRSFDTWESYGGGPDSSQYSSLKQINKSNVKQLQMAWSYPIGGGALTFGPIVVGRTMYVTKSGSIVALDAATGKELWTHQGAPAKGHELLGEQGRQRQAADLCRPAAISPQINAVTGATITSFGNNGVVDPTANSDRPVGRARRQSRTHLREHDRSRVSRRGELSARTQRPETSAPSTW